jgi:hypothetical protein
LLKLTDLSLPELSLHVVHVEGCVVRNDFVRPRKPFKNPERPICEKILKASVPVGPPVDGVCLRMAVFARVEDEMHCSSDFAAFQADGA